VIEACAFRPGGDVAWTSGIALKIEATPVVGLSGANRKSPV